MPSVGAATARPAPHPVAMTHKPSPLQQSLTPDMLDAAPHDDGQGEMDERDGPSIACSLASPARKIHRPTMLRKSATCLAARPAPLVGRYEQALLTARMSSGLRSMPFEAQLGVIGSGSDGMSATQIRVPFTACFHPGYTGETCVTTPYVGKIDLGAFYAGQLHRAHRDTVQQLHRLKHGARTEEVTLSSSFPGPSKGRLESAPLSQSFDPPSPPAAPLAAPAPPSFPGYRVPRIGRVQLVLRGPEAGQGVPRVMIVPYDVHTLSPGTQCIVRHTCYAHPLSPHKGHSTLRYAVQLRFVAPPLPRRQRAAPGFGSSTTPRVYLFGSIRLAFSPRLAGGGSLSHGSMDDGEQLFRSSQTWGLSAPEPECVEPIDALGPLDPLAALDGHDLLHRFHAPLHPLGPRAAFPPPQVSPDTDAFAFSGPGPDWIRAASRARAAVRTLRERIRSLDTHAQLPDPDPRVEVGPRPVPGVSRPVPIVCPHRLPTHRDAPQTPGPTATPSSHIRPPCTPGPSQAKAASPPVADAHVSPIPVDSAKLDQARRGEGQAGWSSGRFR